MHPLRKPVLFLVFPVVCITFLAAQQEKPASPTKPQVHYIFPIGSGQGSTLEIALEDRLLREPTQSPLYASA